MTKKGSRTTHGMKYTDEYRIWCHMRSRCENPNFIGYKHYGGRNIKICAEWALFVNFYKDMGQRPSKKHSIDRIDPNGNYEPSNCRWATMKTQQNNRTNNVIYTYNGKTATLAQLCEEHKCKYKTVYHRLTKGLPIDLALTNERIPYKTMICNKERLLSHVR